MSALAKPDGALIPGDPNRRFGAANIETFMDHRIAMSFVIAATRAETAITIRDVEHVATSFPNFKTLCAGLGVSIAENQA